MALDVTAVMRLEGDLWVLDVAGHGVTQVTDPSREHAAAMVRDYVATLRAVHPDTVHVTLTGETWHGTENGYHNRKCRCTPCRDAHSTYMQGQRARRAERGLPEDDPRHGKHSTYLNWGCRCRPCTTAHSAARQATRVAARARKDGRA